jgi:hypothetical protein
MSVGQMIVPSAFAVQSQMALSIGQPPPCAPVGLYGTGGAFTTCCPGLIQATDAQGFIHCSDPGTLVGSFTTGPINTSGQGYNNQCNRNNGCEGGRLDAGTWERTCHEDNEYSMRGAICVDPNPDKFCPGNIGQIAGAQWVNSGGAGVRGNGGNSESPQVQCVYLSIANPFDAQTQQVFNGPGASSLSNLKRQYCDGLNYNDMLTKNAGQCSTVYTTDYDFQQVLRINNENPNGAWVSNNALLQVVQQVATGSTGGNVTVSSSIGKQYAQNMITNYCLVTNPNGWADNDVIRAIINSWVLQNSGNIGDDCQQAALDVVNHFCQTNPTSSYCDCYTAMKLAVSPGPNIFTACKGNTSNACSEIHTLADSMAQAPSYFTPQIATLQSYITPNCAVGQCVSAAYDGSSRFLPPSKFAQLKCESDIRLCLSSVKIGGSLMPGATINQNCQQTIGLPGSVSSSNQGFQNAQAVQAGGTLVATSSPSGTTTGTTTTSTPSGTVQQVTAPPPGLPTVAIPQDQQVAAAGAGAGLLGLSSSSLFCCCCVIIVILLLSMNKKQPAPRPIVLPGGF